MIWYKSQFTLIHIYRILCYERRDKKFSKEHISDLPPGKVFTLAKDAVETWRQLMCPLIEDWIMEMWCIYTVEYHSAIRKHEVPPFATLWMDLESIILSKTSQSEKAKNCMI